jgi:hypothetical protein
MTKSNKSQGYPTPKPTPTPTVIIELQNGTVSRFLASTPNIKIILVPHDLDEFDDTRKRNSDILHAAKGFHTFNWLP